MINVGIVGYGNLGKGVHSAVINSPDMNLVGIFTRRNPESVEPIDKATVYAVSELDKFVGKIDILICCGGSATDLPKTTGDILRKFNTVDSFDTHAKIPEYFESLDKIGKENDTLAGISIGWDPGLFSIARSLFSSCLPVGQDYTFWGKGVSQGHSDAIRRIKGVKRAVQYTIPKKDALDRVLSGENPSLTARDKHLRECFLVIEDGESKERIENEIKNMPFYFSDYDTVVNFIDEDTFVKEHTGLPHGGLVIRSGEVNGYKSTLELKLDLKSNPFFTGSVLTAYARAVYRLRQDGKVGAVTVLDVPVKYLSTLSEEELRKNLL